jgi:hypothetical protein
LAEIEESSITYELADVSLKQKYHSENDMQSKINDLKGKDMLETDRTWGYISFIHSVELLQSQTIKLDKFF